MHDRVKGRPKKDAPPKNAAATGGLALVFGEDDYRVEHAARGVIAEFFPDGPPELGIEIIEGRAANQGEALRSLEKLFESLQTFGFFSSRKIVWWKSTNLLGDNVTSRAKAVNERIGELVDHLKEQGVAADTLLLITADSVDARKSFYKHSEKTGRIISFKNERSEETEAQTARFVEEELQRLGVCADPRAVSLLMVLTDGEFRLLRSELEKMAAYAGPGGRIDENTVQLLASARPEAIVWDLTGALDRRDVLGALQKLSQLQYQQEEPMGLLFAIIAHVRTLLFLRELLDLGVLKSPANAGHLAAQIARIPAAIKAQLPQEKKWNPLLGNPYSVFHRMAGAEQYTAGELRKAMQVLLECNEKMVSSSADFDWLENALLKILTGNSHDVPSLRHAVG